MLDRCASGRKAIGTILTLVAASAFGVSAALAQSDEKAVHTGATVIVDGQGDDIRAFGARVSVDGASARVKSFGAVVDVRGAVEGDIWAAGADVNVVAQSGGSVRAAGAQVTVRGRVAEDVMVAGASLDIGVASGGELRVAGANVQIGPFTDVGGSLAAAGANIVFGGRVAGEAKLAGAVVTINGQIDGPVTVHAERLILGPAAVIGGGLLVRSLSEPTIDDGATIEGDIVRESPGDWFDDLPEVSLPILAAIYAAAIILSGVIFLIFARNTYSEAVDHVRFRPVSSALYGIVAIIVGAIVAALLMATVIGLALGTALLLVTPIVLVLAQPVAAAGIVGWIFGRRTPRLGVATLLVFLIVGALVIAYAGLIPITGAWIVLIALIFGIGGLVRALLWRFRTARTSDQYFGTRPAVQAEVGQGP